MEIQKRIDELKVDNDNINLELASIDNRRNELIKQALQNNGAIVELQKLITGPEKTI